MNILVVYDSMYGNTKEIAKAIAGGFGKSDTVKLVQAREAKLSDLQSLDLLVVGSPTQGGRATSSVYDFFTDIPQNGLSGVGVAAFDTRFEPELQGKALRLVMGILGYAATKIGNSLTQKGGRLVVPPEGFIVRGKEGPLKEGELKRAATWAAALRTNKRV
ncbi:hypothetical protein A2Z00_00305 [Candidatus Gottesmanbacteria bacterium RBG_13_45_10]|uniref:Flavodoxin-like domain-containing protein n=1 Tax=Candidatus Gottesmanbacteria bacterium RBG_13_45_10 TaxID=1798370 RepID=A0A1F5ZIF0_9BACT|nr:MAG: hypothetical protein A2Z00_00305 [Candidatus Gottesmanbacteria bacterium RBG_13_45_10]